MKWMPTLIVISIIISWTHGQALTEKDYVKMRERMVNTQIERRGISDERTLQAMRKVPREEFVPREYRAMAYDDSPLPIGYQQTISQPYIVGFMTEAIQPQPSDRVLEIGTGSGYQAAVLSQIVKEVYTIEIVSPLGERAKKDLKRLNYDNVTVKIGDGYQGWKEHAPFDKVILTAAPPEIPRPLIDQLKEGGLLIAPVGRFHQELVLLRKKGDQIDKTTLLPVRFVPMTGEAQK